MKKSYIFIICLILQVLTMYSCDGDFINLGDGYFYRNEGPLSNMILCKDCNGINVPENVVSYDYDSDFIIAKQKPGPPNAMNKDYEYKNGMNSFYYWIIIKDGDNLIGPAIMEEFDGLRKQYNVPESLELEE